MQVHRGNGLKSKVTVHTTAASTDKKKAAAHLQFSNSPACSFKGKRKRVKKKKKTFKFSITNFTPLKQNSARGSFIQSAGGKHRRQRWRTSLLSVAYGLRGRGIILFLEEELARARTCTQPAERKPFHFRMLPPASVFQSTCPDAPLHACRPTKSLRVCRHVRTSACCPFKEQHALLRVRLYLNVSYTVCPPEQQAAGQIQA